MSNFEFEIPEEWADSINHSMQTGGTIQLPFPAPIMWWNNGDRNAPVDKGASALWRLGHR